MGRPNNVLAHVKAHATGRWAEIIFRALSSRITDRWRFVSFRGINKSEWRGVVDLVAIRINSVESSNAILKRGDFSTSFSFKSRAAPRENPFRTIAADCGR